MWFYNNVIIPIRNIQLWIYWKWNKGPGICPKMAPITEEDIAWARKTLKEKEENEKISNI